LAGGGGWLNEFEANREYSKGTTLVLGEHEGVKIGTLFCPEIFSPELYREITDLGAEILVNISGHGIFRGSESLLSQTRAAVKLRAVENNRYLIQIINYNLSSVIDNRGNIIFASRQIGNEIVSGKVSSLGQKTFYSYNGNWILLVCLTIICLSILQGRPNSTKI